MTSRGNLYVVSAPSGAGKTSLVKSLLEKMPDLRVAVSHTTRPRRTSEEEGVNYYFVCESNFKQMVSENAFIEHASVFGNYYGTSRAEIEKHLTAGKDIILEIDWQGATQIRQELPECLCIFILPPSLPSLRTRLQNRAMDDQSIIDSRMNEAIDEISHYREFDYLVVNDDFLDALADLTAVVQSQPQRLSLKNQAVKLKGLLSELLNE